MQNMLRSKLESEVDIFSLSIEDGLQLSWDARLLRLTYGPARHSTIRLDTFSNFAFDLSSDSGRQADIGRMLKELSERLEGRVSELLEPWPEVFGTLAFFSLRFSLRHDKKDFKKSAEATLEQLGPRSEATMWRICYATDIPFEHRNRLLDGARRWFGEKYGEGATGRFSPVDIAEKEMRESYWWTIRCQYELTRDWVAAQGAAMPTAQRAFAEASRNYLNLLKDDPRRQDMERFLSESGSSVEKEVKEVLLESKTKSQTVRSDETIRTVFISWFLKKDDLRSATRLSLQKPGTEGQLVFVGCMVLSALLVLALFAWQTRVWKCSLPSKSSGVLTLITGGKASADASSLEENVVSILTDWRWLFGAQVLIQFGMLAVLVLRRPEIHRVLMPRAFYASLLAWVTIVPAAVVEMHEKAGIGKSFHSLLVAHTFLAGIVGLVPMLFLYILFWAQASEVNETRPRLDRPVWLLLVLYGGALFWGMIFGLPVKLFLERSPGYEWSSFSVLINWPWTIVKLFQSEPQCLCPCIFPILSIGSSIAVCFGVVIRMVWEDKSVTELLSEPL